MAQSRHVDRTEARTERREEQVRRDEEVRREDVQRRDERVQRNEQVRRENVQRQKGLSSSAVPGAPRELSGEMRVQARTGGRQPLASRDESEPETMLSDEDQAPTLRPPGTRETVSRRTIREKVRRERSLPPDARPEPQTADPSTVPPQTPRRSGGGGGGVKRQLAGVEAAVREQTERLEQVQQQINIDPFRFVEQLENVDAL